MNFRFLEIEFKLRIDKCWPNVKSWSDLHKPEMFMNISHNVEKTNISPRRLQKFQFLNWKLISEANRKTVEKFKNCNGHWEKTLEHKIQSSESHFWRYKMHTVCCIWMNRIQVLTKCEKLKWFTQTRNVYKYFT